MANSNDWEFVFTWHIDNFFMLKFRMDSPIFVIDRLNHTKWYLRLEGFEDKDCFFLRRSYNADIDPAMDITLGASLDIIGPDPVKIRRVSRTLKSNYYIRFPHKRLYKVFKKWDLLDLTVRCTVWGDRRPNSTSESHIEEAGHFSTHPITQEYYSVVDDGTFLSTACRPIRCSARTRIDLFRRSFTWKIEDFDLKDPNQVSSIRIESGLLDLGALSLSFHYRLDSDLPRFWVEVRRIVPDYTKKTFVKGYLTFASSKSEYSTPYDPEEYLFQRGPDDTWELKFPRVCRTMFGQAEYVFENEKQNYKYLTMEGEITMAHEGCVHHFQNSSAVKCKELKDVILQRDIQRMQGYNTDFTLQTKDGSVKVHRNILILHSDVLKISVDWDEEKKARIGNEEKTGIGNEEKTGIANEEKTGIEDEEKTGIADQEKTGIADQEKTGFANISVSLVEIETLIKFMYGHPLDLTPWNAPGVLAMAHMYNVPALFDQCFMFLMSNVTPQTAPFLLKLADLHGRPLLMDCIRSFMVGRGPEVLNILHSKKWEKLMRKNRSIALAVANDVLPEIPNARCVRGQRSTD